MEIFAFLAIGTIVLFVAFADLGRTDVRPAERKNDPKPRRER